ncbi:MAG TPA: trypsin-like peptidase domain-containing protein [Thermoanaerobaculia bacterium]|nr:trypsin-like peptidase domain-containing protein [Thermoanaerobaculia bacterium]
MRPRVRLVVIALLIASCRHGDDAKLDDVQKMAYGVKPGVVRINAYATAQFRYDSGGRAPEMQTVATGAGGSGSGFIIHPDGLILTSGHVVAPTRDRAALERELRRNGAIAALLKRTSVEELRRAYREERLERMIELVASNGSLDNIAIVDDVDLSNGVKVPFRVERYSPALAQGGADLALLRVDRKNLPVVPLGDSDRVRVGESIWTFGYPAVASSSDEVIGGWLSHDTDLEATLNPGSITAIKRDVTNTPVFQSNVAIYRGNSGGPAVNRDGDVIGISTWGHRDADVKFLVPVNVAKGFLAAAKVPINVESDFSRHYRAALDAAGDGRWPLASAELTNASRFFPGSPDLLRFRADTDRALKAMPLWRQHPAASGALLVALVGAGVAIAVPATRRRQPKPLDVVTTSETFIAPSSGGGNGSILGKFTILNGSRAGQRLGLGGSGIRIGRESAICEIVLENPKVSRLHAEVVSIDGKVLLIDRNSSNGTYVNDQKIDKRYLKDGDIIYFGGRNAVAVAFHA